MQYTKLNGKNIDHNSDIIVKHLKVMEGATAVFEVTEAGTVKHGKSVNELSDSAQGIIVKSSNGHRWSLQISDTGQIVSTDLGGA